MENKTIIAAGAATVVGAAVTYKLAKFIGSKIAKNKEYNEGRVRANAMVSSMTVNGMSLRQSLIWADLVMISNGEKKATLLEVEKAWADLVARH